MEPFSPPPARYTLTRPDGTVVAHTNDPADAADIITSRTGLTRIHCNERRHTPNHTGEHPDTVRSRI